MWVKAAVWIAKIVAAGLIVSFLSIWTTGYIVNSYVQTLLKQYNLPLEVQPMALSGVWGKLWGAEEPVQTEDTEKTGTEGADGDKVAVDAFADQPSTAPLTDIGIGGGSKAESGTAGQSEEAGTSTGQTEGSSQTDDDEAPSIDGTETAITTEDMNNMKGQMSEADKDQLFGLLMSKLPQEAMQTISGYMENGLTDEELTQIQQLMAQYLDRDQYEQMMAILKKY
ncbi:hypothetical protein PghCCS26_09400 [Paenibacillus glycanilyticus]|uniref:Spore coat protein n=1 Tax=Paenibacillus glycanilyticus TaxID=126569 RepID=A0ABQ6NFC6_9BACL|nr:hypothetical protein [Paenibacillus glycanilyticus]GMK43813.1 hypothetical protein PghCCS26_09400 [Paenibacillus glycanilyticus]